MGYFVPKDEVDDEILEEWLLEEEEDEDDAVEREEAVDSVDDLAGLPSSSGNRTLLPVFTVVDDVVVPIAYPKSLASCSIFTERPKKTTASNDSVLPENQLVKKKARRSRRRKVATYFSDPESFVAQALQNGQNGYNGGKKVFVSCNF